MAISAAQVMELRSATGAGLMDCKKALEESGGDPDRASDFLRKKGVAIAAKKASRETNEGGIAMVLAAEQKSAALVHLGCETDFVARNERFQELLQGLTEHVLANGATELHEQQTAEGVTVGELITQAVATLGENLQLVNAERLELAGEGVIGGYVHSNGRIGALVALEAQGSAELGPLAALAKDLAMHIAASQVSAITADEIDPAILAKEREIYAAQAREAGKPEDIVEKMVAGRLAKYVKEISLLQQPFVKDPEITVEALLAAAGKSLGVALRVARFIKYQF